MNERELIELLRGCANEQLPLTLNLSDIRQLLQSITKGDSVQAAVVEQQALIVSLEHQVRLLTEQNRVQTKELQMFRGMGAQGNFVAKVELGLWQRFVNKVRTLLGMDS